MSKLIKFVGILLSAVLLVSFASGCSADNQNNAGTSTASLQRYEETRDMWDTYVKVLVYAENEARGQEVIDAAFARMQEVGHSADSWNVTGEVYKLNETGHLDNASPELLDMIKTSLQYNTITEGAFDITVQPLLDIWQYDPNAEKQLWELDQAAQQEKVDEAMKLVGSDKITISGSSITLAKGSAITLGGIAKGYAGDEALKVISSMGVKHALIDAGGDIKTLNGQPNGDPWNIALVNPDDTSEYLADFYVKGKAVTTSGNYERYFSPDKTVSHIMDPRTGFSADECISVTIITDSGTEADILATAVFVLGPEKGMQLVESLDGVETMIVGADRKIYKSSGLSAYMK